MGGGPSSRNTKFDNPHKETVPEFSPDKDDSSDEHISISHKMVERLVEDATMTGGTKVTTKETAPAAASAPAPKEDVKEKQLLMKIEAIDEAHSQKCGLTIEGMSAVVSRIEKRTSDMVRVSPVCADCADKVIECYNNAGEGGDVADCWDTISNFTKCVQQAASARLVERTNKEARENARKSRQPHPREYTLKDLAPTANFFAEGKTDS